MKIGRSGKMDKTLKRTNKISGLKSLDEISYNTPVDPIIIISVFSYIGLHTSLQYCIFCSWSVFLILFTHHMALQLYPFKFVPLNFRLWRTICFKFFINRVLIKINNYYLTYKTVDNCSFPYDRSIIFYIHIMWMYNIKFAKYNEKYGSIL